MPDDSTPQSPRASAPWSPDECAEALEGYPLAVEIAAADHSENLDTSKSIDSE